MSSAASKAAKQTEEKIRELARKKSNKNCFDCGKSGPQNNVNLTHNTFVCTQCAGIHRHFSHVVKTINMVNFTQSEVDALETGGNKRAHKYWHGRLDETTHKLDADDPQAVKTFMEQVYKEKRWVAQEGDKLKVKPKKDKKTGLTPTHTSNASISTTPTAAAIPKKSPTPDKAAHRRDNSESTSSQQSNSQVQQPQAKPAPVHDAGIDFLSDMGSLSFESSSSSPAPAGFPSTGFGDSRAGSRRASGAGLFGVASSHIPTTRYATPQAQIMAALQQTASDWGLTSDALQQHTAQALQTYIHQHTTTTTQTSQPTSQHRSNGHVAVNTNDDVFADIGQEQEDSGNPFADDDDDDDGPFGAAPAPTQSTAPTHLSSPAVNVMMSSPTHTYTSPQATPFGTTSPQATPFGTTSPQPNYYTSPQQGFGQQPNFAATPQGYPPSMAQAQPFPPQGFPQQQPFPGQGYAQPYPPQGYTQYPNPAFASLGPTVPLTTSISAPIQPAKPAANNNLFSNLNPLDGF